MWHINQSDLKVTKYDNDNLFSVQIEFQKKVCVFRSLCDWFPGKIGYNLKKSELLRLFPKTIL